MEALVEQFAAVNAQADGLVQIEGAANVSDGTWSDCDAELLLRTCKAGRVSGSVSALVSRLGHGTRQMSNACLLSSSRCASGIGHRRGLTPSKPLQSSCVRT